ncbi:peptidase S41 family protein [Chaetomium tenue]|uniref:Peptidase S41 family protein n=1 Tax=Chaetomium tenue TaxID=1854479 RepID=A0ACB7NZT9_9PEZI|nr:peptidase S41 family protein [Chaetomium globosum]
MCPPRPLSAPSFLPSARAMIQAAFHCGSHLRLRMQLCILLWPCIMKTRFACCVVWAFCVLTGCLSVAAAGRTEPCAQVQAAYSVLKGHQGENARSSGIPGQVAYDCLRSMPFHSKLAVEFLDEYVKYLQFHATIDVLKEPPSGYISTSVDVLRGMKRIRGKAVKGFYTSHYDFDYDLRYLISRANDGHLGLELCSLSVMHFEHGVPLVSLSRDGLELPQIYAYADAKAMVYGTDMSPVIYINGQDPTYFLQANIGATVGLQDPDARYNSLFPSPNAGFEGRYGGGYWTNHLGLWPGPRHTLEFANGTQLVIETTASLSMENFDDVVDGESLFRAACLPERSNGEDESKSHVVRDHPFESDIPPTGPPRYPLPLIQHEGDLVRGYYLDGDEHQDVAVLQLPTFKLDDWVAKGLSVTANTFLDRAHADGKTRLIIDMSGNGGGNVNVGFNFFQILFPHAGLETRTRFRRTKLIRLMGKVFSSMQGRARYQDRFPLDLPLAAHLAVSPDQRHAFASWEDLYGSTGTVSEMYATFNLTSASTEDNPIEGFGPVPKSHTFQLFGADSIVIMTDGHCASTCVLLASLLVGQGVRSIVFGGRPRHAPMQLLGGVKGGQYWSLRTASRYIQEAYDIALHAPDADPILSTTEMARFREIAPLPLEEFPLRFDKYGSSGVNFRNAYGESDGETPLQFVYEAADCRLFFTAENVLRPETTWRSAARAMFGNGSCVSGSPRGS